jgi:autotransporter translocation and assembly factor TamB
MIKKRRLHLIKHGIKHGAKHSLRALIALTLTVIAFTVFSIIILAIGLAIFLNSPGGLQFSKKFATQLLAKAGNVLVIENLTGTLSNFSADHLLFSTPSMTIEADHVHLDSLPGMLFFWKLHIKAIETSSLRIHMQKSFTPIEQNSRDQNIHKEQDLMYLLKLSPKISIEKILLPKFQITFSNGRTLNASLDMTKAGQTTLLNQFNLRYPPLKLKLKNPTKFENTSSGGTQALTWNDLCLVDNTDNKLCLSGQWQDNLNFSLSIRADLTHLSLLDNIFPQIMDTSGEINGTLSAVMKKGKPNFSGELVLKNGSTYVPITGMHPENLNLTLKPEGSSLRLIGTGEANADEYGSGKFIIEGLLFGSDELGPALLHLSLIGNNINIVNLAAGTINASPNLTYRLSSLTQSVTGNIIITHADINGDKIQAHASNNTDIAFISPSGEIEREPGHLFGSNISIVLGDDIHFRGFGVKASLNGQLLLQSDPGESILATGRLDITEGQYVTYGKKFLVKHGALIFEHSLPNNPNLNIKVIYDLPASITQGVPSENIQLGVTVTGTLITPKFGFFSTPPMSQTDILSYIVLGTPLNKASANQQSELSQAALSYALNNGDLSVINDLKQSLGIDSFSIGSISNDPAENLPGQSTTTSANNTAVFIGKQINPRLYVSYGLGVFNQTHELRAQFALSNHWSLLTNSATSGNGADIVFTLDR